MQRRVEGGVLGRTFRRATGLPVATAAEVARGGNLRLLLLLQGRFFHDLLRVALEDLELRRRHESEFVFPGNFLEYLQMFDRAAGFRGFAIRDFIIHDL